MDTRDLELLREVDHFASLEKPIDLDQIAEATGVPRSDIERRLLAIESMGLFLIGSDFAVDPLMTHVGRQVLDLDGEVKSELLSFLPIVFDDLHTREAFLNAGVVFIDEFSAALLGDDGTEFTREFVPQAFAAAIDEQSAVSFFAAASALLARLSCGTPAACVAEEIIAVRLQSETEFQLEIAKEIGKLSQDEFDHAVGQLDKLFELFQDDDVLRLFEMKEPADAAVQSGDSIASQLGVVDQRVSEWFKPFGWSISTGHLDRP